MTRFIFLDFDGVLNSQAYFDRIGTSQAELNEQFDKLDPNSEEAFNIQVKCFDPEAVKRLNRITKETGAEFVLTTNWRRNLGPGRLVRILKAIGVAFDGLVFQTPVKMSLYERSHEIGLWLHRNLDKGKLNIESFVILEDLHPMHEFEEMTIRVDSRWGLREHHVEMAIDTLTESSKDDWLQLLYDPQHY